LSGCVGNAVPNVVFACLSKSKLSLVNVKFTFLIVVGSIVGFFFDQRLQ
jgi:hypothetical protein